MIRVAGKEHPWRPGMSVADLLRELGDVQETPVVRIDDRYVSRPNYADAIIPDNAEIFLIPMIAGG
ncbi:MAG: sulfur carrier protein ThiS [Desulfobacterales bacterium]